MKIVTVLLLIISLLVGLPVLHGFLVLVSIDTLAQHPNAMSFFYLFATPAWAVVIMVFVVETYRRNFIRGGSRISNTLMLGLAGMIAPAAGLALSPVGADIGISAFAGISVLGLFVGMLGAILFNFAVTLTGKTDRI